MSWNEQCRYRYYLCGITVGCNRPLGPDIPFSNAEPDTCIVFRSSIDSHESVPRNISSDDTWYPLPEMILPKGWIREDGRLALLSTLQAGAGQWSFQVRQIIPFLAGLQGQLVLHASAVQIDGKIYAFVGESGAGKSTLAKALADSGAIHVADDLLPVACDNQNPVALTVNAKFCALQQVPLGHILFLSRASSLYKPSFEQVSAKQFMLLLLRNGFAEMSIHRLWKFQFKLYGKLIESVDAFKLVVPDNLALLPEVASEVCLQLHSFKGVPVKLWAD